MHIRKQFLLFPLLFAGSIATAAPVTPAEYWVLQDLTASNMSSTAFPWAYQPFSGELDGRTKRWNLDSGLIPVKTNGVGKAEVAMDRIEQEMGMQLFDRNSIASTPDEGVSRGLIISVGTSYVVTTPDDPGNQANVSAAPYTGGFPWGFFDSTGEISTRLYINLGTTAISVAEISMDVVIHEFLHALGLVGAHFEEFGYGDALGPHAMDVVKTLYANPIGAAAGDLTFIATASPVPIPGAVWLFSSGLLGLVGIARRKKAA